MSHEDFWVNFKRETGPNDELNIYTTSEWHMFNQYQSTNAYTGWDSSSKNDATSPVQSQKQYLVDQASSSSPYRTFADFNNVANHRRMCQDQGQGYVRMNRVRKYI